MSDTSHSNRTAQAFAIESSPGTLPGSPTWFVTGPNAVGDPGQKLTRKARTPISPNNQRQFGGIVDVTAAPKFDGDLTLSSLEQFVEQFCRCQLTGPAVFRPTSCTSAHFVVASGGALPQYTLVYVRGARTASNNGLKVLAASSTGTNIIIAGGLTAETFTAADNVTVEVCGYRFISGDLQIVSGNLVTATKDLTTLGLASGQTCWLGGTTSGTSFATAADRGPFRIALAPAANLITTDKRYGSWTDDAGTGKTVDLYFGRQLRVVPITDANYLERHIRWETTYHRLGAANAPAYGYTVGCAISQATLTLPEKDLATMALEFMANSEIAPSTSRATNASAPFRETKKAAFSTVSDVFRGRVLKVDPSTGAVGAGLTGYITAVNLTLKNNTSYNGAHGVQGSFETSFGMLEADLKVNAYFTEIDAVSHANSNLPVTADWFLRNNDGAFCMDVPYAELAIDGRNAPKDQTIKIDLGVGACEDSIWGTSLIVSLLPYCPAA